MHVSLILEDWWDRWIMVKWEGGRWEK